MINAKKIGAQFLTVASTNLVNALSKAAFLSVASFQLAQSDFTEFIFWVVSIDVLVVLLDLGASAAFIVVSRDVAKSKIPVFGGSALIFKMLFLLTLSLLILPFVGIIIPLLMSAAILFEFQNAQLQSSYKFKQVLIRQAISGAMRVGNILVLLNYDLSTQTLLALYFGPQLLISFISCILAIYTFSSTGTKIGEVLNYNRLIWQVAKNEMLLQAIVLVLRRGDIYYATVILGAQSAGKIGLLFTISQFLPMIGNAVTRVVLPYVLDSKNIYQKVQRNSGLVILSSVLLSVFMSIFLTSAYLMFFSSSVRTDALVALLVFWAVSLNTVFQPLATILYKEKRIFDLSKIHLKQLALQAIASITMMSLLGLIGVALSFALVRIFGLITLNQQISNVREENE